MVACGKGWDAYWTILTNVELPKETSQGVAKRYQLQQNRVNYQASLFRKEAQVSTSDFRKWWKLSLKTEMRAFCNCFLFQCSLERYLIS